MRTNNVGSSAAQKIIQNRDYDRTTMVQASSLNVTGLPVAQSIKVTKRKALMDSKLDRSLGGNSANLNHSNIGQIVSKVTQPNLNKSNQRNGTT